MVPRGRDSKLWSVDGSCVFRRFRSAAWLVDQVTCTVDLNSVSPEPPRLFSSTEPFGTPLAPASLMGILTFSIILVLPTFNFVVNFVSYPSLVCKLLSMPNVWSSTAMCTGIWILRRRRMFAGLPRVALQARNSLVILCLSSCMFPVVIPRWVDDMWVRTLTYEFQGSTRFRSRRRFILVCNVSAGFVAF